MDYVITPELLRRVAGAPVKKEVVDGLVKYLPEIMDEYGINTKLRLAHFLAQIAHESDHFRTLEEYASGSAYEGRRDLGNVRRGDGRRYKGRGVIQLTGRHNYRKFGEILGLDLENNPELAATPRVSILTAAEYWKSRNLNKYADQDDVREITRRINGGFNGLQDRIAKVNNAKKALALKAKPRAAEPPADAPPPPKKVEAPKVEEKKIEPAKVELPFFVMNDLNNKVTK